MFLGFTEKSNFFGGFTKNRYGEGDCLKRGKAGGGGLSQFVDLRGGLARKRGWAWYPNVHYAQTFKT